MPPGEVEGILIKAEAGSRREAVMMNDLWNGRTTMDLLGLHDRFRREVER